MNYGKKSPSMGTPSVYSHVTTRSSANLRSTRSVKSVKIPWYQKRLLANAVLLDIQRGAMFVAVYSFFLALFTIATAIFDIYCLSQAAPGSIHYGYYLVSYEFVYVGNRHEGRVLELHSPDGVHECWLRAADSAEANVWFNALHSALAALTLKALRLASVLPDPPHLQHIGWLARRHCIQNGRASSESSEDGAASSASTSRGAGSGYGSGCAGGWRSVFGAVSGRELRLYECAPWSPEAWAMPSITCPLIATRLVSSPAKQNEASSSNQYGATFAVRVGTPEGVITHNLRAETRRDLAAWARAIVQGCHAAAHSLREYTIRCVWQGRACQLVVHHEEGFALYAAGTRGVAGSGVSPGSPPTPLWRRPFDKLRMSADDGARLLWLDFGEDDSEIELDLEGCPKPIVFVLHNFLSAKIHRLGLSA